MFTPHLLRAMFGIWIAVITIGSFLPSHAKKAIGTQSSSPRPEEDPGWAHRTFHFISFGVAAVLGGVAARGRATRLGVLAGVAALGSTIEISQSIVNGTRLEFWDIRDDIIAVAAGGLVTLSQILRRVLVRS